MSSWRRWIYGADNHGDKQDDRVIESFLHFCNDIWKPHDRIHGGDNWNFGPLRKGASDEEKSESMECDYDAGKAFLRQYHPRFICLGNHDARLWERVYNANGDIRLLASQLVKEIEDFARSIKCEILPYDARNGIAHLGRAKFIHGFYCGKTAAARTAATYRDYIVFGHDHTISEAPTDDIDGSTAYGAGCLCQIDQDYNKTRPSKLRHANGWRYGIWNSRTGDIVSWQARKVGKTWILPSDVVSL